MPAPLRVLLVEDNEDDAELLVRELGRIGFAVTWERVDSEAAMVRALDQQPWDLILSDFQMPGFGGPAALSLHKRRGLDTPFLIISGTINEEEAVESMKAGAHDFLSKTNLARLGPAVVRELRETQQRRAGRVADEQRRAAEERYRMLVERMPALTYLASTETGRGPLFVSPQIHEMTGFTGEEWLADTGLWTRQIHPDDRDRVLGEVRRSSESGEPFVSTYRLQTRDGRTVWWHDEARPTRDPLARRLVLGFVTDVTEQKRLEAQLLQAQKMEAVGQLAGGVAHDFNNLLSVITGYSEMLLDEMGPNDPRVPRLTEIRRAAERAASLTRQLLAFSRKQVLQPRILDLNSIVTDTEKMLRRLIGENIDLVTVRGAALGRVRADPGQLEQIIMNLTVNARDAMPQGGRLTIETANREIDAAYTRDHPGAQTGSFVMLSVADTGSGMDRATQARIFEPFFTTKEAGRGTGLGLSTVYGIVKQSGGYIEVDSEPGRGTTFRVLLPRTERAVDASVAAPAGDAPGSGDETVLLVEDNAAVAAVFREVLEARGYRVLPAKDAAEAIEMVAAHTEPIHLLMTDMMMPGMSGRELAGRLKATRPEMKVLLVSGYAGGALPDQQALDPEEAFLQKPFSSEDLARKVRAVLEGPAKKR